MPRPIARPDADPAITTETTDALPVDQAPAPADDPATADDRPAVEKPQGFFLSEGVRGDLEIHGQAVDPATGALLKKDKDTGEVTATSRGTGKVTVVVEAKK